jgi:hypothetical protein
MNKVACIGSRETPANILILMEKIGAYLVSNGYIVSSGNANGADQAFARGANRVNSALVHLYLPWPTYEYDKVLANNTVISSQKQEWFIEAAKHHPNWDNLKDSVRKLMARNIGIVEGSCMVICYLNHSKPGGGGTGQGVRYARACNIPVLDLSQEKDVNRILEKIR